jgi:hypothetical protein
MTSVGFNLEKRRNGGVHQGDILPTRDNNIISRLVPLFHEVRLLLPPAVSRHLLWRRGMGVRLPLHRPPPLGAIRIRRSNDSTTVWMIIAPRWTKA